MTENLCLYASHDIKFTENLTLLHLPEEMRNADAFRIIVWEIRYENDEPLRTVFDLIKVVGSAKTFVRYFNKARHAWDSTMMFSRATATLRSQPDFDGRIEAYRLDSSQATTELSRRRVLRHIGKFWLQ